jgi:hypothetical protein
MLGEEGRSLAIRASGPGKRICRRNEALPQISGYATKRDLTGNVGEIRQ